LAVAKDEWLKKLSLLIEDENLRERFGRKGRESIQNKFTIEANAAKFVEIILSNSKSQTIKREARGREAKHGSIKPSIRTIKNCFNIYMILFIL